MIAWAGHDEISLSIATEDLAKVITEDKVLELVRCGFRADTECIKMFV
jgi:hypothetical protein